MANLIDKRTNLEGIIYAFINNEGSLIISSSKGSNTDERHMNYQVEIEITKEGVDNLRALLGVESVEQPLAPDWAKCTECLGIAGTHSDNCVNNSANPPTGKEDRSARGAMSDYREYSKVINVEHGFFERRMFLKLDCGHEVYRYKKVAPKLVRCEFCHRPAWFPVAEHRLHMDAASAAHAEADSSLDIIPANAADFQPRQ